ncbi:MAG: hypothetical protein KF718_20910 [Polyangiaceae bacterium]|nr:hypothetical protein [Polyangiaceae bacterium]
MRTITSTLISNSAKPCIDVFPVPARTNEMGAFSAALAQLMTTHPALDIRLVSYDAGAASLAMYRHPVALHRINGGPGGAGWGRVGHALTHLR